MKLIDEDAFVAEIDKRKIGYNTDGKHPVEYNTVKKILDIFVTLEVKEVDLEKEIEQYVSDKGLRDYGFLIPSIAQHFFKLGLNASNPLTFEDIRTIDRILDGMRNENQVFGFPEGFYNEALKRFKAQKVEKV